MRNNLCPCRLVALALCFRSGTKNRFTGHVDPKFSRVKHLDTQNVVLTAVASTERFCHRRNTDSDIAAVLSSLFLIFQELFVANCFEGNVEAFSVLA